MEPRSGCDEFREERPDLKPCCAVCHGAGALFHFSREGRVRHLCCAVAQEAIEVGWELPDEALYDDEGLA